MDPQTPLIDRQALVRAMIVGTALQIVLAASADLSGWIAQHALFFGAMILSAIAGYLYAQDISKGYLAGATGGLVAGGVSGLFGTAFSVILGNTDPGLFLEYVLVLLLTGGIGGLFGQMAGGPARH